jgi:nucleoside-diphosphate-sugar epimerase
MSDHTVLLLGGTGRTGGRVLEQLLGRGVNVRAIVRSAGRLPEGVAANPALSVIEADMTSMSLDELGRCVSGCDAVISCLGHNINLKGMFGPPRDLVTRAVSRVCGAIEALRPAEPVKVVWMSTVSVNRPGRADFLVDTIGTADPFVRWVAVRPDTLREGDVTEYSLHEGLVASLAKPDDTNMSNVAQFMCELAEDQALFERWAGKMPVIINETVSER